jgi:hypothetical protein
MLDHATLLRHLDGELHCGAEVRKVTISDLQCNGCIVIDLPLGPEPEDFIRLRIADSVEVSGHIVSRNAGGATIRFHGEVHPFVVRRLQAGAMAR